MSILLGTGIIDPALRIAGLTKGPGTIPDVDIRGELVPAVNRMLGSWNCDGAKVFGTSIDAYNLVADQIVYTIGPSGNFNNPRPLAIEDANFIFPSTPAVRIPIKVYDSHEWSLVAVQSISGAPPWALYYDSGLNSSGQGSIYLIGQPPAGYQLELYTWTALKTDFSAVTDTFFFPPGYEAAVVTNLALKAAQLSPDFSIINKPIAWEDARKEAQMALNWLRILNAKCPTLYSEAARIDSRRYNGMPYPWLLGPYR